MNFTANEWSRITSKLGELGVPIAFCIVGRGITPMCVRVTVNDGGHLILKGAQLALIYRRH